MYISCEVSIIMIRDNCSVLRQYKIHKLLSKGKVNPKKLRFQSFSVNCFDSQFCAVLFHVGMVDSGLAVAFEYSCSADILRGHQRLWSY